MFLVGLVMAMFVVLRPPRASNDEEDSKCGSVGVAAKLKILTLSMFLYAEMYS